MLNDLNVANGTKGPMEEKTGSFFRSKSAFRSELGALEKCNKPVYWPPNSKVRPPGKACPSAPKHPSRSSRNAAHGAKEPRGAEPRRRRPPRHDLECTQRLAHRAFAVRRGRLRGGCGIACGQHSAAGQVQACFLGGSGWFYCGSAFT